MGAQQDNDNSNIDSGTIFADGAASGRQDQTDEIRVVDGPAGPMVMKGKRVVTPEELDHLQNSR